MTSRATPRSLRKAAAAGRDPVPVDTALRTLGLVGRPLSNNAIIPRRAPFVCHF
jgi:hypothetical protein